MVVVSHPPLIFHAAGCVDADTRHFPWTSLKVISILVRPDPD